MDVTRTPIVCILPTAASPAARCAPRPRRQTAAIAAVIAAGTAAACTACCVLPFTLPVVIVADVGGVLTMLDRSPWLGHLLAIAARRRAWLWIGRPYLAAPPAAVTTLAMMAAATMSFALTASWPLLKPAVFRLSSIAKTTFP